MTDVSECGICIEKFNAARRKRVVCSYCPADAMSCCVSCVKTYLLQDDAQTPRCPSCRSGWTEDFLTQTFAKTWLLKEYKAHREQVLLDMERARLPEAQEDAARYRRALQTCQDVDARIAPIQDQMERLPEIQLERDSYEAYLAARKLRVANQLAARRDNVETDNALSDAEAAAWTAYWNARNAVYVAKAPFKQQINVLKTAVYREAAQLRTSFGFVRQRVATETTERRNQWTFVMKCPLDACQGFVGTNWKCGLCEAEFCKDCGDRKEAEEHVCNPDVLATHQALRKEAKPCPKCAAMISKIDGCDQMWCTQCQTAFSWRTGAIETSHVHNPHYFQWMRQNGGVATARPIGDCLNLTPGELLEQVHHYARMRSHVGISEWVRCVRHYMYVQRHRQHVLQTKQNDEWKRQLRVRRLVNELTDAQWKDRLQRGEKAAQKEYAVIQVLELFTQAALDLLRATLPEDANIPNIEKELQTLRKFCNDEFLRIKTRFNNEVEYIANPTSMTEDQLFAVLAEAAEEVLGEEEEVPAFIVEA